jgi:hypothetical protein
MGRLFLCYLEGRVYSCKMCKSHLAKVDELVSKVSAARPCPAPRPPRMFVAVAWSRSFSISDA